MLALQATHGNQMAQRLARQHAAKPETRPVHHTNEQAIQREEGLAPEMNVLDFALQVHQNPGGNNAQTMQNILATANAQLTVTGAPAVIISPFPLPLPPSTISQFNANSWDMDINNGLGWSKSTTKSKVIDTIYHETHHAEQFYRIARYSPPKG
jgi:hypothetical protein